MLTLNLNTERATGLIPVPLPKIRQVAARKAKNLRCLPIRHHRRLDRARPRTTRRRKMISLPSLRGAQLTRHPWCPNHRLFNPTSWRSRRKRLVRNTGSRRSNCQANPYCRPRPNPPDGLICQRSVHYNLLRHLPRQRRRNPKLNLKFGWATASGSPCCVMVNDRHNPKRPMAYHLIPPMPKVAECKARLFYACR